MRFPEVIAAHDGITEVPTHAAQPETKKRLTQTAHNGYDKCSIPEAVLAFLGLPQRGRREYTPEPPREERSAYPALVAPT